MKLELVVMAQSLARLKLEVELAMARCEAALADILAESVASTLPSPAAQAPITAPLPAPEPARQPPRVRYAPGELRASVMAIYRSVEECSVKEAFARLQIEHHGTKMDSLRASIFDLVTDGYLQHGEQRGVYRLAETKRPLSMVK